MVGPDSTPPPPPNNTDRRPTILPPPSRPPLSDRPRRAIGIIPPKAKRVFWDMAEFADTFGLTTEQAGDLLRACDPPAAKKIGGRWKTSRELLRRAFPEEWPEMVARLVADDT